MAEKNKQNSLTLFLALPVIIFRNYTGFLNKNTIEYWQHFIFYIISFTGVVAGTLCIIPSIFLLLIKSKAISAIFLIVLYFINVFTIFFKSFSLKTKTLIISFNFYLIGVISIIVGGPVGESWIWFLSSVLFCSLFVSLRISVLASCINLITGIFFGIMYSKGLISWYFLKNYSLISWIILTGNIFFISILFSIANSMLINGVKKAFKTLNKTKEATIIGLAKMAEYKDTDTGLHLERIREYARLLAHKLSTIKHYAKYISTQYIDDIYLSSALHDIGKVGIPDTILLKPGKLTQEEFETVKKHTIYGKKVIEEITNLLGDKSVFNMAEKIAYHHHEKWDGSGYPEGLSGEDIPLSARIISLVDVYDALTTKRVYKEAFSHEKALAIIVEEKGRQFDPLIVEIFLDLEKEFNKINGKGASYLLNGKK